MRVASFPISLLSPRSRLPGRARASAARRPFAADFHSAAATASSASTPSLDGAPARTLMLDTGNAHSTLIADVASELGWTLDPAQRNGRRRAPASGSAASIASRSAASQAPTTFYVFERALLGQYQPPVDGSLTYDFFKDRVLEIDYPHHRIRFTQPIATPPPADKPEGAGSLKLITFGERGPPVVVGSPFTVNGKNVRAQIDTVFTGTMLIYDSALDTLGLHKEGAPELFRYTDGGVDLLAGTLGQHRLRQARLLGGAHTLYFVGDGNNPVHQPDGMFEATVGNALFANSIVTLDFHAMTIDVRDAAD